MANAVDLKPTETQRLQTPLIEGSTPSWSTMTIKRVGKLFELVSKKTGKRLMKPGSKAAARKREREVEYFKHVKK